MGKAQRKTGPRSLPRAYAQRNSELKLLFSLVVMAKGRAQLLSLPVVEHFANMTLLQIALDWEGLTVEGLSEADLERLLKDKERIATDFRLQNHLDGRPNPVE